LISYSGAFLAGFVMPYIANWRGRKTAIFVSIALSVISLITMAVSPYIELLIIFLIITGLAFSGFEIMSFVYTAEASGIIF
jgi:MFS family permease